MNKPSFNRRRARALLGGLLLGGAALTAGCLERPVVEQTPNTSNVFVEQIVNTAINKIDLLFVIDNSVSMADKQAILVAAVPEMVGRLVSPGCIDPSDPTADPVPNPTGTCPAGLQNEFNPVNDIHIGVITSSLGGHGADACGNRAATAETPALNGDDQGLLIPKVRSGIADPSGQGFLEWNGPEVSDRGTLAEQLEQHVAAAGENGCGFEAPLEAWYRFLVDPSPPAGFVVDEVNLNATSTGPSAAVLEQRGQFLRDDSLVAIVVLTDENDCSIMEGNLGGPSFYDNAEFGWLVAEPRPQPNRNSRWAGFRPASSVCEENPNDVCCYSCLVSPPEGCQPTACVDEQNNPIILPPVLDRPNARCFDQRRRFGLDLLYPVKRYVDGLTQPQIVDSQAPLDANGQPVMVDNPLLRPAGGKPRPPGLVFFAGIVGVPWQDIATAESLDSSDELEYLTSTQISAQTVELEGGETASRWDVILGQPFIAATDPQCRGENPAPGCGRAPIAPLDPFMIEAFNPRPGVNPIDGSVTIPPDGTGKTLNGHEYINVAAGGEPYNDDLQYSCIFPLEPLGAVKTDCDPVTDPACDCGRELDRERPLCKESAAADAPATNNQYWGKAYPATRVLQVLKQFGNNSIVASICPKILDDGNPDFGYNPAVEAIIDRLAEKLSGQCLPRELTLDDDGSVPCAVVEALDSAALADCGAIGREPVAPELIPAVRARLEEGGFCTGAECDAWNLCEIPDLSQKEGALVEADDPRSEDEGVTIRVPAPGSDLALCQGEAAAESLPPGFCYIDPAKGPAAGGECQVQDGEFVSCTNPQIEQAKCPASQRRLLRFVGKVGEDEVPFPGAVTFVACVAEAAQDTGGLPSLPGGMVPTPSSGGTDGGGGTSTGGLGMGGG